MQGSLQPVQRIRLQQRVRRGGQVVDVGGQHFAVLVEEWPQGGKQAVELLYRIGEVVVGACEPGGQVRQVLVQGNKLLIVLVQRVDEKRQAVHHREEVAPALVQRGQRPRQAVQCGVDLLALARQAIGVGRYDVTEGPFRLFL